MKIAFLVSQFPVLSEAFIINQITGLLDRGHQVDIYALSGSSGETQVHPDVERYALRSRVIYAPRLSDSFMARLAQGARIVRHNAAKDPRLLLSALNVFRYGKTAASLRLLHLAVPFVGGKSYDIIHAQFGTCGLLGLALRDMGAIAGKLVTTFRGFDISEYPRRQGTAVYHPLFAQGDLFLANCEFFRQRVIELGCDADRVWVHGSSIDCEKFGLAALSLSAAQIAQGATVRLLTVGRLTEKKGIAYAIRAVAQLVEKGLEKGFRVRYDIVGEGHLRADLVRLIEALGLENEVHLLGSQPQPEIIAQLRQAHIFLAPCVTAQNGDQDAPVNTLKEAMATGLPVVSTWHGGIPELVEDGISGYLVPERDEDAIAEKVADLIAHPERWSAMGLAGRQKVLENYELNYLSNELVSHYEQLLPAYKPMPTTISTTNVTLVVVPRERFSYTRQSLESIYRNTQIPFELIYVDGNSPAATQTYLEAQANKRGFKLIRTDCYLSPNQARNIGLAEATTQYLVFIDNDVILSPGWLQRLITCAEETGAAVVGPLMCQDEPVHQVVHFAGGESHVWTDSTGRRRLREKMYLQGKRVDEVRDQLQRGPTELAEFHCALVRRDIFDRLGPLDEGMLNTKEHLDFCMAVREAGEQVYFEPDAVVTYVPGPPLKLSDVHFYMLRWSNTWTLSSLQRIREKWALAEDSYFTTKYRKLGWRRRQTLIDPFARRLLLGVGSRFLAKVMGWLERPINHYVTRRYAYKYTKKQLTVAGDTSETAQLELS